MTVRAKQTARESTREEEEDASDATDSWSDDGFGFDAYEYMDGGLEWCRQYPVQAPLDEEEDSWFFSPRMCAKVLKSALLFTFLLSVCLLRAGRMLKGYSVDVTCYIVVIKG